MHLRLSPWDDTGSRRRPRPRKRALGTFARRRVAPAGSGRGALATPGTRRGAASGTGRSRARPLMDRRKIPSRPGAPGPARGA